MRLMLAGTRTFGAAALNMLVEEGHNVVRVWTPDGDAVEHRALVHGITAAATHTPEEVEALDLDAIVCAHSHAFVSKRVIAATRYGAFGYHPSALPRHRGRDAVGWTIHMRDPIAGGSVYWLNDTVDGGPLAAREFVHVDPRWDASDLWRKSLFPMGIRLLQKVARDVARGQIVCVPQDERCATVEPSFDQPRIFRPDLVALPPAGGWREDVTYTTNKDGLL